MAETPQRTLNRDFTVTSGDTISGDDATGGAGGDLKLQGGDATAATNTDGGDVILQPGAKDGSGTIGVVRSTHSSTDQEPIFEFVQSGTNSATVQWHTGSQATPEGAITGSPGDLYISDTGTAGKLFLKTSGSETNTGWTELGAGTGGTLEAAVENTGATDANMDQSFDWRITDSDTLEFSNSDGTNPLLTIAPAAAGDNITVGGTVASSTVTIQGPTTGTGFCTVTHGGADSVPLMTWTTSGSGGDSVQIFTGSSSPNARVTGAIGSFFLDGTNGKAWINTDGSTAWTDLTAGAGAVGISTLAQIDTGNQTTGSIAGSGGTASLDITSFINEGVIYELSVTRTAGTGGDDIDVEIFSKDTKLTGDRLYLAEAADASTAYLDASGIFYEDEDNSAELHIKITNNSAAAATFDVRARAQGESPVGQVKQIASWVMGDAVLPASNPAGTGTRGDHNILAFDQTTSEHGLFEGVIPEDYDGSSAFSLDLVWTGASAGSGTDVVEFEVAWRRMTDSSYDLDDNTFATAQDTGSVTVPTTSGQVKRSTIAFTNAQADGVQAGNAFRIRVTRDTGIANNFAGDAQLTRVQVHT